jgi:transposase
VLAFFRWIDLHVPRDLEVQLVLDNLSAHSALPVADWLADPRRAPWHLHFTPTSASWLNLVEGWFAQLTNRRLEQVSSPASLSSSKRWTCGHPLETTTPNRSSGTRPRTRLSPRSAADEPR